MHKITHHLSRHKKHVLVIALSLAVAHGLILLGREMILKHLEISLALAGVGSLFTE